MSTYSQLIFDLSKKIGSNLTPQSNSVTILVEKKIPIQIEVDKDETFLIIAAHICSLPPGKFREHVLRDALKANENYQKLPQVLSYLHKENTLVLHRRLFIQKTTIEILVAEINAIKARAITWLDSIDSGHSYPQDEIELKKVASSKSIFNM